MDLATLKRDHPGVYAQAVEDGTNEERNRVNFHAKMGLKNGAEAMALKACQDGVGMNDGDMIAEYMTAGMNKTELSARQTEETEIADNAVPENTEAAAKKANVTKLFAGANVKVQL